MTHGVKFCAAVFAGVIFVAAGTVFGYDNLQLRMFKIAHGNGKSICETAQVALSPDGKMSFDAKTNTLVVVDRPDYLPHIEELVSTLDIKVPVVEISVRIVEVEDEFRQKSGIRSAQIIFPRGSFNAVLNLLNPREGAFTKSEMTLKTISGAPAQLQVSREELFGVASEDFPDGSAITYVQKKSVGDFLEVLPIVNHDNTVTVKLRPSRSGVQDNGSVTESAALAQVTLHSGDTLAIGGVDTQSNRARRKTMIFLTARIIY